MYYHSSVSAQAWRRVLVEFNVFMLATQYYEEREQHNRGISSVVAWATGATHAKWMRVTLVALRNGLTTCMYTRILVYTWHTPLRYLHGANAGCDLRMIITRLLRCLLSTSNGNSQCPLSDPCGKHDSVRSRQAGFTKAPSFITGCPAVREKSGKFQTWQKSGKSQGILLKVREIMNIGKSQGKVREFAFIAI